MSLYKGIIDEIVKLLPTASFSTLEFVFYYLLADKRRHADEED